MTGIDTNILVRYLVQDDPIQSSKAANFIRKATTDRDSLFISSIVLAELVWVLEAAYRYGKVEIARVLELILSTEEFEVEYPDETWLALEDYRNGAADFSDCLLGLIHRRHGCETTATFDSGLKDLPYFTIL